MMAYISNTVSASPVGRAFVKLRNGPIGYFATSSFFDWVIPPTLAAIVVAAGVWIAFFPK